jgi:hypothetical protein
MKENPLMPADWGAVSVNGISSTTRLLPGAVL